MSCPRCTVDPQPSPLGSPRNCAFDKDTGPSGSFSDDNWNCATLEALLDCYDENRDKTTYGHDETMDIIPCVERFPFEKDEWDLGPRGWIILTRYKRRGKCSSAVVVGDFFPPRILTYAVADATIRYLVSGRGR